MGMRERVLSALRHYRLKTIALGLLASSAFLTLISCGTFRASLEIQNTSPGSEFTEVSGYVFAENAILLGYRASDLQVSPGGELDLDLHWELEEAPAHSYTIGIRLIRERGAPPVWQHSDNTNQWVEGYQMTHHHLRFPSQINAGNYGVEVWLQHPQTGAREPLMAPEGPLVDRVVRLMTLRVTDEEIHDVTPRPPADVVPVSTSVFTSTSSTE